jgi:uncharacterized membrane protein YedE/YeeE
MNLPTHPSEHSASPLADDLIRDQEQPVKENSHSHQLLAGALFGILFGFLLQKGGVAKYHILIGSLLLEDFTVMKVMLTAIIVGGIGVFSLHALGLVKLDIKPTRYAANIIGGLVFGVGFGLLGYCPGTGAAALGQGNWDVLAGIVGLLLGSYLFAELSGLLGKTINKWGDRGELFLHELLGMRRPAFLLIWIPLLALSLFAIDRIAVR